MTYFARVKAKIIASEVDFEKKSKRLIFFLDFRSVERVNEPKKNFEGSILPYKLVVFTVLMTFQAV